MAVKPRVRYRVTLRRTGRKPLTAYTHAGSASQAKRFAQRQKRGYTATTAARDPMRKRNPRRLGRAPARGGRMRVVAELGNVDALYYTHTETGEDLVHEFGRGVKLQALEDGSLRIAHSGREPLSLWENI